MPDPTKTVAQPTDLKLVVDIYHQAEQLLHDNPETDAMFDGIAATADMPRRTMITLMDARAHLEDIDPEAHANLVHSVLAGRTANLVSGLAAYADKNGFN